MSEPSLDVDVAIVGAGIVGTSCAYFLAKAGLRVCVIDRGGVASGASGSGEGNVLVSDKAPGPELELAKLGVRLWAELAAELGRDIEYEPKGGIIVAENAAQLGRLHATADEFARAGVAVERLDRSALKDAEPYLAPDLPGGVRFPDDAQIQPMKACAALMQRAEEHGATFLHHQAVTAIEVGGDRSIRGVETGGNRIHTGVLINAAGPWSAQIAALAGIDSPVEPRKGHIVVTEPLPPLVRHKVYEAGYGKTVSSGEADLQIAAVLEATRSGTILLGSSRQRVGFEPSVSTPVIRAIAQRAARFFPVLAGVRAIRAYAGFRPFSPDHLPIIGPDPRLPGYYVNIGHEGAGIGLGPISARLLSQVISGERPEMDLSPFAPSRFIPDSSVPA